MLMFGIRDAKADCFIGNPIFVRARGQAVRAFADQVNESSTDWGKYPADFSLFELGEFDEVTGKVMPRAEGILDLGNGLAYLTTKG